MANPSLSIKSVFAVKAVAAVLALGLAVDAATAADPTPAPERVKGYLEPSELPDSVSLLPAPPAIGSPAESLDSEIARYALTLQGTPRFAQAARDADLSFPYAASAFACALQVPITPEKTPTLYRMLQRMLPDAGAATGKAKDLYRHARPFMMDEKPTCAPASDDALRRNGSYPSGHTSIGWAWAEVLAEIAPDRADAVLARGRAFGESRIVCNVHWASDVMEGRLVGAATVVALHAKPEFRDDLAKAKSEIDAARASGEPPTRDCSEERAALQQTPWLTP